MDLIEYSRIFSLKKFYQDDRDAALLNYKPQEIYNRHRNAGHTHEEAIKHIKKQHKINAAIFGGLSAANAGMSYINHKYDNKAISVINGISAGLGAGGVGVNIHRHKKVDKIANKLKEEYERTHK